MSDGKGRDNFKHRFETGSRHQQGQNKEQMIPTGQDVLAAGNKKSRPRQLLAFNFLAFRRMEAEFRFRIGLTDKPTGHWLIPFSYGNQKTMGGFEGVDHFRANF